MRSDLGLALWFLARENDTDFHMDHKLMTFTFTHAQFTFKQAGAK